MYHGFVKKVPVLLFPLLILSFFSCEKEDVSLLKREDLFRLSLGVMSDELDYTYREKVMLPGVSDLTMDEGIFYISNENMEKVMGFNSYGDLITLIYNSETNPEPRELDSQREESASNKRFIPWAFYRPGELGLSGDNLLVEDKLPADLSYFDDELQAACDTILLRFDEKGEYRDFIGRGGVGGEPFPYIAELAMRENGEFAVVSRLNRGWWIYWFSAEGEPLYQIELDQDHMPVYREGHQSSVSNVVVDPLNYRIFLMINYYPMTDSSGEVPAQKRLYQFDLATRQYNEGTNIPDEIIREGGRDYRHVFELIGVTDQGGALLISPTEYNHFLLIGMSQDGKILFKREITTGEEHIVFTDFYVDRQGILTALTYQENFAQVSWWRTDRLFRDNS